MHDPAMLQALLDSGLSQCHQALAGNGPLVASLGLAGLVGGASHCAGMCGPFVLSQVGARLEAVPLERMREWHRLSGAAVLPYHLGRATTYGGLGVVAASVAGSLGEWPGLRWLSAGLLLLAALAMLGMALPGVKRWLRRLVPAAPPGDPGPAPAGGRLLRSVTGVLFRQPTGWRGYLLGVALGFLPCGLVYGALAAVAASADPATAMIGMLVFTAGTLPALLLVGLAGHLAGRQWRQGILRHAPLLLLFNAGVLTWLAWRHIA